MTGLVRWVEQKDSYGCGIATLAMLLGEDYDAIKVEIDASKGTGHDGDWSKSGISHVTLDNFLISRGWYLQRIYRWMLLAWPPEPWAFIHYAQVTQSSGNSHFVVMEADGVVWDPMQPSPRRLGDWSDVSNVHGLLPPEVLRDTGAHTLGLIRQPPVSLAA